MRPDPRRWTIVFGHHAIYGTGAQGDMDFLGRWYWRRYLSRGVDVYLAAHNHHLEHLRVPGESCEYVVSGAGGSHYREHVARGHRFKSTRAQSLFSHKDLGLAWFHVTAKDLRVEFLDGDGNSLMEFSRSRPAQASDENA